MRQALGVEPTLITGVGGVFDVTVDGTLIYSKHKTGSFPNEAALVKELSAPR